jgi:hypothetical protein
MEHLFNRHIPASAWMALLLFWSICGLAIWKGGREERLIAAVLILNTFLTPIIKRSDWASAGLFVTDVVQLIIFLLIALKTRRWWPLFAAAIQLLMVLTHTARHMDPTLGAWAYITGGVIWTYALLGCVLFGALTTWRTRVLEERLRLHQ